MNDFLSRFDEPIPMILGTKVLPEHPAPAANPEPELQPVRFIEHEAVTTKDAMVRPKDRVGRYLEAQSILTGDGFIWRGLKCAPDDVPLDFDITRLRDMVLRQAAVEDRIVEKIEQSGNRLRALGTNDIWDAYNQLGLADDPAPRWILNARC